MRKGIIVRAVLILGLLISLFVGVQPVKASPMVMIEQPWYRVTGVNQPVEFTANASGGTPPYTFQWYTTFLDPTVSSDQWKTMEVPNSNSSTFTFIASTPGRYGISINVTDSNGDGEYQSFQPIGIVVTVQSSSVPQSTPSLSPSPTASPNSTPSTIPGPTLTPTVPEFPWLAILPLLFSILCIAITLSLKKQRNFQ